MQLRHCISALTVTRRWWPAGGAVLLFLLLLGVGRYLAGRWVAGRFADTVQAVTLYRGYQGLILDTPGVASLLIAVNERQAHCTVERIEVVQSNGPALRRMFSPRETAAFPVWFAGQTISVRSQDMTVHARVRIADPLLIAITLVSAGLAVGVIGLLVVVQASQRRRAEIATARQLQRQAAQVAHDLRSPLSSLEVAARGLGALTGRADAVPRLGQYVQVLQLSARRLGEIANDLLARHGNQPERPIIFSVHGVLDTLIGEYQCRGDLSGVTFRKQYHPHGLELFGLRSHLQRAIGNIVKNAIEAMQGHGLVTLTTFQQDGCVVIAVADTGPGMPPETLVKVLAGGHTQGKADGHGIGTQVVREVVEGFGGQVAGESAVGEGTTFRLVLPAPTPEQCASAERETLTLKELLVPVYAGEPVIVVDDESSVREQWRVLLGEQGTRVELCTGYDDVERRGIAAHVSRTAIVDYHFADSVRSGLDVIRLLRTKGIEHFILCTAEYWRPNIQGEAKALGVCLCPKPVPEVIRVIAEGTDQPQQQISPGTEAVRTAATLDVAPTSPSIPKPNVLVVDDDDGIRLSWRIEQERLGIGALAAFSSMEDCEREQPDYPTFDYAFVDKNIPGSHWRIDQVISRLKSAGVRQVIVATGESVRDVESDPLCAAADGVARDKIPESLSQFGGHYAT